MRTVADVPGVADAGVVTASVAAGAGVTVADWVDEA